MRRKRKRKGHPWKVLTEEERWNIWCDYKHTSLLLREIEVKYEIVLQTIYHIGRRYGDDFRRGRGHHIPCPISPELLKLMWEEYKEGKVSMWKLEEKYGVGMQWVYKVADESSYERRRPDKIVRIWKRKLTPELEKAAWKEYEAGKKTVVSILKKYKINNSTLYDIGDRLGSTFRRHKSIAGEAVKSRWRYARNQRGVPHPSVEPEASVD